MPIEPDADWRCQPVAAGCWDDLEQLLGEAGGREGCWCMRWRLPRMQFERELGAAHRRRLRDGVARGSVHGLLGYLDGRPAAWVSFGPRTSFPMLAVSDALAPVDPTPVWSVSCFYVAPWARRRGATVRLLQALVVHARALGVAQLEGYPLDPPQRKLPVAACWTGLLGSFLEAGFVEVARRAPARPLVRCDLRDGQTPETAA